MPKHGPLSLPATANAVLVLKAAGAQVDMPDPQKLEVADKPAAQLLAGVPGAPLFRANWLAALKDAFPSFPASMTCPSSTVDVGAAAGKDGYPAPGLSYVKVCGSAVPPAQSRAILAGVAAVQGRRGVNVYDWLSAEKVRSLLEKNDIQWNKAPAFTPPTHSGVENAMDLAAAAEIAAHRAGYLSASQRTASLDALSARVSAPIGVNDLDAAYVAQAVVGLGGQKNVLAPWVAEVQHRRGDGGWFYAPVASVGTVESTFQAMRIVDTNLAQAADGTTLAALRSSVDAGVTSSSVADYSRAAQATAVLHKLGALDADRQRTVSTRARTVLGGRVAPRDLDAVVGAVDALRRLGADVHGLGRVDTTKISPSDPQAAKVLRVAVMTQDEVGTAAWRTQAQAAARGRIAAWTPSLRASAFWADASALVGTPGMDDPTMRRMYAVARDTRGCAAFSALYNAAAGADLCDLGVTADAVEATGTEQARLPDANSSPS